MVNLPESTSQRWTRSSGLSRETDSPMLEYAPHAFQQSRCSDSATRLAQRQAGAVSMPPMADNNLRRMEMPLGATVPFSRRASDYASVNMHAAALSPTSERHENSGRSQFSRGNSDGGRGREAKEQSEIVRAQRNDQVGAEMDVSPEAMLEDELLDEESLDVLVSTLARETAHIYPIGSTSEGHTGPEQSSNNNSSVEDDDRRSYESERSSNNKERTVGDSDSSALSSPATTPFASKQRAAHSEPTSRNGKQKQKRIRKACSVPNCGKRSRSQGLCIAHGGGRRCIIDGCDKSSQGGNLCIKHGGGKRCSIDECDKAAQTNSLCKAHGGGPRCQFENCEKSSQGGGFCRTHGGGKRCAHGGCMKGTQRGNFCAIHGGLRLCIVEGCLRNDRGGGFCAHHGGGKRCSIEVCDRACRRNGLCSSHLRLLGHMRVEDLLESLRVHSSPPPDSFSEENQ